MEQTSTKPSQVDEEAKTQAITTAPEQPEGATPNPDAVPIDTRKEEEMTASEVKAKQLSKKYNDVAYHALLDSFSDIDSAKSTTIIEKIRLLSEFIIFAEKYNKKDYFDSFMHQQVFVSF